MENCVIYSHRPDFKQVIELVKTHLPKAKLQVSGEGLQKSLVAAISGGIFGKEKTLTINYRERKNPSYTIKQVECALTQNLSGMVNFIQSLPAANASVKNKFIYKIMAANAEMAFMAEPEITQEFETLLKAIAQQQDSFLFSPPNGLFNKSGGQYFTDKNLRVVLDMEGNCEVTDLEVNVDAKYHDQPGEEYTSDQLQRKASSEAILKERGIKVNQHLPCVVSEHKVKLRELQEVIDRAYALLVIAAKGEGVEREHLDRFITDKKVNSFTARETEVYDTENMDDTMRAYATWRYESLYVLLWALGKTDELKYPSDICDVAGLVSLMMKPSREEFEQTANLRSAVSILNELDKTYRMNWACVNARLKNETIDGGVNPSIIYERHYALNWLTNYEDQDWDNVQTPT